MRNTRRSRGVLRAIGISLGLGLVAIGSSQGSTGPIKVGLIEAFSGPYARWGTYVEQGMRLAVEEINAQGGVEGRLIELVIGDDEFHPGSAVAVARRLIENDGIVAAYGPNGTPLTLATIPVFEAAGVPHIVNTFGQAVTKQGSYFVFRAAPNNVEQNQVVIDFAAQCLGKTSFAIIRDSGEYGQDNGSVYAGALANLGLQPVADVTFNIGDKDFTPQLLRVDQAGADALVLATTDVDSGLIARQVEALGLDLQLVGNLSQDTGPYAEVGGSAIIGTIALSVDWVLADESDKVRDFLTAFEARWGSPPESYMSVWSYDDMYLIYEALKFAGPEADGRAVADGLHRISGNEAMALVAGVYDFDETGEGFSGMKIVVYGDDGAKNYIDPGSCE